MASATGFIIITIATLLGAVSTSPKLGGRPYDACAMCDCIDRARVVNCTGLNLRAGLNVHYPSKMQVLILNSNNFTYLGEAEFENCPELVTLKLQSNYIKSVHPAAFRGLTKLQKLYLCSNLIETLHDEVFTQTKNLTYLSLQYNSVSIQSLSTPLQNAPNLQTLDLTGLPMGFSNDYALPIGFQKLTHLQLLYLEESVDQLPGNFFSNLQNSSLFYLSLARSRLGNISSDVFMPLPGLEQLELSRTLISVPSAEIIFEAVAKANLSLDKLNLRHNFVVDDGNHVLSVESFRYLQNASVHFLHLEKSWSAFPDGHLRRHFARYMPELRELYLDTSRLNNIHAQAFKDLHELKILGLSENYLNCFTGCEFLVTQHFRKLIHLDLSNNVISDEAEDFRFKKENFPALEVLELASNKLHNLRWDIFGDLKHLRRLDLSMNPLKTIEANAFLQLHHLQYLRISDCPLLEALPSGAFKGLRGLRTLILNNNNLLTLGKKALDGLNNLESLSMRSNNLGQRHRVNYTTLPFHSSSLTFLDLGENELDEIPYGLIAQQPQLSTVYLDHNRISYINPELSATLSTVTLLDLSYNDIQYLDKNMFSSDTLPHIRNLNLAGNPIICDCSIKEFLDWLTSARKTGALTIISAERHLCFGPISAHGTNLFDFHPTDWECRIKVYFVHLLSLIATVFITCTVICVCRRPSRDRDDDPDNDRGDYDPENDLETVEETGPLTNHVMNGHSTPVADAQGSSSVESSQSSITGLCLPLHNFRRKGKREGGEHEGNGHVLLESDDSDPEDTIVEDAVV